MLVSSPILPQTENSTAVIKKSAPRTRSSLGKFIRDRRKKVGLSQWDIARELGYETAQYVSNWERGVSNPPMKTLKKLGELLDVQPDEFFNELLADTLKSAERNLRTQFNRNWRVIRKKSPVGRPTAVSSRNEKAPGGFTVPPGFHLTPSNR